MRRTWKIIGMGLVLVLATLACNLPTMARQNGAAGTVTPTSTPTLPPVITATPGVGVTQQPVKTVTTSPDGACTYRAAFVSDVTIPDNTTVQPGQSFVKTWRLRNDGTCTWGPTGYNLHALAFTSGDKLGAPDEVPLPGEVRQGQTVDISVTMKAPTAAGTYLSNWLLRVDGDPNNLHWVGTGPSSDQPFYVLIKVPGNSGGGGTSTTRVNFDTGATSAAVQGQIGAGERKGYVLAALKGQVIITSVSAATNDAKVKIAAADGSALGGSPDNNSFLAMAQLPSTQDYIVWVTGASSTSFTLDINIPSRISFSPGATSAEVSGQVRKQMVVSYLLRASAGQTMSVNLVGQGVGLTIYGLQDGEPIKRAPVGDNTFNGQLSRTQDYVIQVVPNVETTSYTMKVTVK